MTNEQTLLNGLIVKSSYVHGKVLSPFSLPQKVKVKVKAYVKATYVIKERLKTMTEKRVKNKNKDFLQNSHHT